MAISGTNVVAMILVLMGLTTSGCGMGPTLPSLDPGVEGPVSLGQVPMRERRPFIPGFTGNPWGLAPPEPGITSAQCNELFSGGPHDGCVTAEIQCGQTIVGHTIGGVKHFDTTFYEKKFCTPATTNHMGGDERVYRLITPDHDHMAIITLDTPCADLDVAAFKWKRDDCPNNAHLISQCEMWPEDGNTRETLKLVSQHETTWLVVVEGKGNEEGAFSLTVQCKDNIY